MNTSIMTSSSLSPHCDSGDGGTLHSVRSTVWNCSENLWRESGRERERERGEGEREGKRERERGGRRGREREGERERGREREREGEGEGGKEGMGERTFNT